MARLRVNAARAKPAAAVVAVMVAAAVDAAHAVARAPAVALAAAPHRHRHAAIAVHALKAVVVAVIVMTTRNPHAPTPTWAHKAGTATLAIVAQEFFKVVDGFYVQTRCDIEIAAMLQKAETNREVGKRGGRPKKETQKAAASADSENPEITQTVSEIYPNETLATSHKPIAIINSVPDGTGSGKPQPLSPDEIIFGYGVSMLTNAGTAEKQARSFLGGLRKQHGDIALVNKLRECAKAKPLQPLEWLAAALPPGLATAPQKMNAQEALEAANRAVADRFLAGEAA